MMKKSTIRLLPLAIAMVMGSAYSSAASAHGYIFEPPSRVKWLYDNGYSSQVAWNPQGVEGFKYPLGSTTEGPTSTSIGVEFPPDSGMIPTGGALNASNYKFMNNEFSLPSGWHENNIKAGKYTFKWTFTAPHDTTYFAYFMTKQDWAKNGRPQTLTRNMFEDEPFCRIDGKGLTSASFKSQDCIIPERKGSQKIYAIWRVANTDKAFYQIIDVKFDGGATDPDEVQVPAASVKYLTNILSTSPVTLDGSASSGNKLSYQWQVITHADKVTLQGAATSKANISLKAVAGSDFDVKVRLTVENSKGTNSKDITMKAKKQGDINLPVAVAGKDFKVEEQAVSAGYALDGSASKNADSYKWTIVKGAGDFWLQEKGGNPWVSVVNDVKARALIPAGKTGQVTYRLTVAKNGKTSSDDITVTVTKKESPQPEPGDKAWDRNVTYAAPCSTVTYNGSTWLNGWNTRGNTPGTDGEWGVWRKLGAANMHAACK
ncbi:lytic polysaccharide monooxygenase [Serratia proteamaculans]|uniref:Chitin-binding type-3 domain-containing protein n=1 Tax=Serratia proteamaculans TaxID=28151 RepID=A0A5Q2VD07_SERPR|nr:lytic polysaccharide monooxygenase [Serratia proteamaculans]QGH61980.1 hypothetical protein GHV41_14605 [Serratia proteamaculans]